MRRKILQKYHRCFSDIMRKIRVRFLVETNIFSHLFSPKLFNSSDLNFTFFVYFTSYKNRYRRYRMMAFRYFMLFVSKIPLYEE